MVEAFNFNGQLIEPGSVADLKLYVGRLPSGGQIFIRGKIAHATAPGPVVLITGGVHGDEINSVHIMRRLIQSGVLEHLQMGTLIVIPIVNVYGFIYFSRDLPDGKDVNRSFPGTSSGSLASRIARTLTKKVLPHIDYGIDLHTGGASRYNYPQIRYTRSDSRSLELARAFGAPMVLSKGTIPKSFRRTGLKEGKPIIVFEGGEALRLDGLSIDIALKGIHRVLHHVGMIDTSEPIPYSMVHVLATSWIRASQAGLFTWSHCSGELVQRKQSLGMIHSPDGDIQIDVLATRDAYIVGHNNAAVVSLGDALFHMGYHYEMWE